MAEKVETRPQVPSLITLSKHWESNPNWKQLGKCWKGSGRNWKSALALPLRALDASYPSRFRENQSTLPLSPSYAPSSSSLFISPLFFFVTFVTPFFILFLFFLILLFWSLFPYFSFHWKEYFLSTTVVWIQTRRCRRKDEHSTRDTA